MNSSDKKRLHYIASGTSYLRLNANRNTDIPENNELLSDLMAMVSDNSKNHEFGVLFNAFTESSFGEKIAKYSGYKHVHSDSGGLQIITQGKTMTESVKDEIYKTQAKNSDMGMCFDEIPIGTISGSSGRNDVKNRWFKPEEMEFYARKTGKNIARQIQIFHENNSACKPILIAQGNDYDTYMKWVDYILDEIPVNEHQYIGGVAMGAAALGTGMLEDIERAFIYSQLPIDTKHLHILGVGSAKRLMPYLIFLQNGLYDGSTVSYDSTTHTSGVELGMFYGSNHATEFFDRTYSKFYDRCLIEIGTLGKVDGITTKMFHEIMNTGYTKYIADPKRLDYDFLRVRASFTFRSIMNFTDHIDEMYESKSKILLTAADSKVYSPMEHLYSVKNKSDFDRWMDNFQYKIKSNRVQSGESTNLEEFFG